MAIVFAIGITVGLSAARWMNRPVPATPVDTARKAMPEPAVTRNTEPEGRRNAVRGISPSELPYDGAPPPTTEEAEVAAVPQPPAASGTSTAESYSGASGSDIDTPQTESAPLSDVLIDEDQRAVTVEEKPAEDAVVAQPQVETPKKATQNEVVPKEAALKEAAPKEMAQKPAGGAAATAKKRQTARAAAKDREIERIKKQADHELRRKLETGRAVEKDGSSQQQAAGRRDEQRTVASASDAQAARVKNILARCERNPNLFRREQCKWRLCGDSWGKNGCPSYAKPASFY